MEPRQAGQKRRRLDLSSQSPVRPHAHRLLLPRKPDIKRENIESSRPQRPYWMWKAPTGTPPPGEQQQHPLLRHSPTPPGYQWSAGAVDRHVIPSSPLQQVPPQPILYEPRAHLPPSQATHVQTAYNDSSEPKKKMKATRVSQACDSCRLRKTKCDETLPCMTCKNKNVECIYRASSTKPSDETQTDIVDLKRRIQAAEEKIRKLEQSRQTTPGNMNLEQGAEVLASRSASPMLLSPGDTTGWHCESVLLSDQSFP